MKKISTLFVLTSIVLVLAACNTMSGVGKDVQKAGEKVEQAASK